MITRKEIVCFWNFIFRKMLVKPEILYLSNSVEMEILEPIIADWMEDTALKTVSDYRDIVELQIIDISLNVTSKTFSVYLSDGRHFINALIDRNLNNFFISETVNVFDIVNISKSTGHPANDDFILVMINQH